MKNNSDTRTIMGRILATIFIAASIFFLFSGSWIKVDSTESAKEVQATFDRLYDRADTAAAIISPQGDITMDKIIDGMGDITIKKFTKVVKKMSACFDNEGLSVTEIIYPFGTNLIKPLDRLSTTNTYSVQQRQSFFNLEVFVIVTLCIFALTLIFDVLALLLKGFGKTGFFNGAAAVLNIAAFADVLILTFALTGYMEREYSNVEFSITYRPVLAVLFAIASFVMVLMFKGNKLEGSTIQPMMQAQQAVAQPMMQAQQMQVPMQPVMQPQMTENMQPVAQQIQQPMQPQMVENIQPVVQPTDGSQESGS